MRRHLNYANVVATMALVFAMGGSAVAARHYLINSSKQINPKVLRALKATGKTGPVGPQGLPGTQGPTGAVGPTFSSHAGSTPTTALSNPWTVRSATVTLPTAGNLMVTGYFYGVVKCGAGASCEAIQLGLTVDGKLAADSLVEIGELGEKEFTPAKGDSTFLTTARFAGLPAGKHTIELVVGDRALSGKVFENLLSEATIDTVLTG